MWRRTGRGGGAGGAIFYGAVWGPCDLRDEHGGEGRRGEGKTGKETFGVERKLGVREDKGRILLREAGGRKVRESGGAAESLLTDVRPAGRLVFCLSVSLFFPPDTKPEHAQMKTVHGSRRGTLF